jgi:hypothetical protein
MQQTEQFRSHAKQVLMLISMHTVVYVLYHYVHGKIDILYSLTEYTPIILILCFAPLAAVVFLSTPSARQGAVVLLGVLPVNLFYTLYERFTSLPPTSIEEPPVIWKILYEGSFGVMLVLEVIAFWITLKLLREIHEQSKLLSGNPS